MQDHSNSGMVAQFFPKFFGWKIFTKSLLPLRTSQKTAIITQFGLFENLFTPCGLSDDAHTFPKHVRLCGQQIGGSVCLYGRDGSPVRQTHLVHLDAYFPALSSSSYRIYHFSWKKKKKIGRLVYNWLKFQKSSNPPPARMRVKDIFTPKVSSEADALLLRTWRCRSKYLMCWTLEGLV